MLILFLAWLLPAADAKFMRIDTETVPVARLVSNLDKRIKENPKDSALITAAARVHAMAYASNEKTFEVRKSGAPFFGYYEPGLPRKGTEQGPKAHLTRAIELYRRAINIGDSTVQPRMGLAWCEKEAGERESSKKDFRLAFEQAFQSETAPSKFGIFGNSIAREAGDELLALLDPKKDATEVSDIRDKIAKINRMPRSITPILVALKPSANKVNFQSLVDKRSHIAFDLDGSGLSRRWGWPKPDAAFLVYDPERRSKITSGLQLFGSSTFWVFWSSGYHALAALDDDSNGVLEGAELNGLALWRDANSDGTSNAGEVRPLSDYHVRQVSTRFEHDKEGMLYNQNGIILEDGTALQTFDWTPTAK